MSLTITDLRDRRQAIQVAIIAYLATERDLLHRWGATAVRDLNDDGRHLLARLAHAIGWRLVKRHARIATVTTCLACGDASSLRHRHTRSTEARNRSPPKQST